MRYRTAELLLAAVLLIICALAWLKARSLPVDAKMFPEIILAVLAMSTVLMIYRAFSGASQRVLGDDVKDWRFTKHVPRFLGSFAIFILYLLVVPHVGFFTASAALVIAMAVFTGFRNWPVIIASTVGFGIFVYLVFVLLFERPLPKEFFLGQAVVIEAIHHA